MLASYTNPYLVNVAREAVVKARRESGKNVASPSDDSKAMDASLALAGVADKAEILVEKDASSVTALLVSIMQKQVQ